MRTGAGYDFGAGTEGPGKGENTMLIVDVSQDRYMDAAATVFPGKASMPFSVAAEHGMDIFINGQQAMRVVCTPQHLDELVVGRLLTEGLVRDPDEIEAVYICDLGLRARVMLRKEAMEQLSAGDGDTVLTCCTDNRTMIRNRMRQLTPVRPLAWQKEWVLRLAERMRLEEPLYQETHAVHGCYLAREGRILCCREDIGRHNAMDKAIGWACIQKIDPGQCLLFTTGRMPSDMVSKAIRSGVPVMASKTFPSDLGITLAKQARLTLITVRPGGELIVWNDGREEPGNGGYE